MRLITALKAFMKAWSQPEEGCRFIENKKKEELIPESSDHSHLRLLTMLQQSSRLIDFLKEDISSFDDAQIGAAVRKIHSDSAKCLEDLVTIRPILDQNEGSEIQVPKGYDPLKIKLIGNIKGEPPYKGILVHKGWKVHKRSLPKKFGEQSSDLLHPAEVEVR
jgi:Domain of unknown function (DUF2760)